MAAYPQPFFGASPQRFLHLPKNECEHIHEMKVYLNRNIKC